METSVTTRWSQRGWGFVVAMGSFLAAFLLDGIEASYGVLMPNLLEELNGSVAVTSLAGGLITGVALGIGPIVSRFIEIFDCRPIALTGGIIMSASLALSTFSVNMPMFMAFYGVFTGLGLGMVYMSYVTIVNTYFDKQRSLVVGIVTSGSGIGLLSMSLLINTLMDTYGWRGCYLIVAAIASHLCAVAFIMRPLKPPMVVLDAENASQDDVYATNELLQKPANGAQSPADKYCSRDPEADEKQNFLEISSNCKHESDDEGEMFHQIEPSDGKYDYTYTEHPAVKKGKAVSRFEEKCGENHVDENTNNKLLNGKQDFPVVVCRRDRSSTFNQQSSNDNHSHDTMVLELRTSPSHGSMPDVNAISNLQKNVINLPPECLSSSIVSLASMASRSSKAKPSHTSSDLQKSSPGSQEDLGRGKQNDVSKPSYCSLLGNPVFLLFCFGAFSFQLAFGITPMFTPSYALNIGLSKEEAASTLSVIGISNMCGRILAGVLSYLGMGSIRVYVVGTLLGGLVCFLVPWCVSYATLLAFAACHGFFFGVFFPLQSVLLVEILGIDQLPRSFGIMCFCKSVASMLGPFLAGALYEATRDYTIPFLFTGVIIVVASLLQIVMTVVRQPCCTGQSNLHQYTS